MMIFKMNKVLAFDQGESNNMPWRPDPMARKHIIENQYIIKMDLQMPSGYPVALFPQPLTFDQKTPPVAKKRLGRSN